MRPYSFPSSLLLFLGTVLSTALCSSGVGERPADPPPSATAPGADAAQAPSNPPPRTGVATPTVDFEIVAEHPHDTAAYTQGLFWHAGYLYEGTGRYGTSWLRRVDVETGEVQQQTELPDQFFGEGIALLGDRIYQLTWLSKRGFIYDATSFEPLGEFSYETEGWGLTADGSRLIMSDGSASLFFLDPGTLAVTGTLPVHQDGTPIDDINELEYVGGLIFANVWYSDDVLQIDPDTGAVVGRLDFSELLAGERPRDPDAVLNGIAYNPNNGHLYVTGKLWPKLFEVRLTTNRPGP